MIYLKKDNEIQTAFIPKNGSYEGKLSYKEGYEVGKAEGIEEGKNNPYSTKGFFFENGEKEFIYPVKIDRDTMLQISLLGGNTSDYVEISFYPMGNGCVLANRNDSNIVCAMRGDLLRVFIYNNLQFELPCKQEEWHTLRLYTDRVILDRKETYFNTPYTGSSIICACVNRGGNGFYRGLIQYMKGVEDKAVMYYISNLDEGGFKRLRSDNGVSDWYENNFVPNWGGFPVLQAKVPLSSVFINVEGGNVCPELTVLDVDSNGRYEGAYGVVNVNVPQEGGDCPELTELNVTENGTYEGTYNKVNVDIPLGEYTITKNGIYDARNGYLVRGGNNIGTVFMLRGGGFIWNVNPANTLKIELLFKPANEYGEFFENTIRGIFGYDFEEGKFYVAEDAQNPNLIYASVGAWESERVELTPEWHIISLSNSEFRIDGVLIANIPEGEYTPLNTYMPLNGIDNPDFNGNYLYPNRGFYGNVKIWVDGVCVVDANPYIEDNYTFGYLNGEELNSEFWRATNNWLTSVDVDEPSFIEVQGFNYLTVDVPQEGGSCNLEETRWVNPHPDEIDGSGYLVYHPTDGYDGMQRIALQMDNYNNAIAGDGNLTPAKVEKNFNTLAFRTENIFDSDIILDRTLLVGSGDEYTENGFISYTQNKNGIVISGSDEVGAKYVTKIRKGALNWNTIEYFYSYTIANFGVDMTRDAGSNLVRLYIKYNGGVGTGVDRDIYFRTGCFATSNRLSKIVFYEPYYINVEENAFEGVSSSGEVVVVGEDNTENRAKYDTLMSQLGSEWTLTFVNEYDE